jgi:hypothetical protein
MKQTLLYFVMTICLIASATAQQRDPRAQIEAAKIALITERLALTPEQAQRFWPIYNEYSQKQENIRREFNLAKGNHNPQTASEEDNKRLLELGLKTKEQTLELERIYSDRLLQVINNRQMLSLRKAESDFKVMILNRLRDQQQKREMIRDRQQDNQELQRRRND